MVEAMVSSGGSDLGILLQNPLLTILIVVIIAYVGKYLFTSKDDEKKIEKDINAISSKLDCMISNIEQKFTGALHNLELKTADRFTDHSEKFFEKMDGMWDKTDTKYVSKELDRQKEERIDRLEKEVISMRNTLEEVKVTGEINASKLDNIIEMLDRN